jgi:hypothetical protein
MVFQKARPTTRPLKKKKEAQIRGPNQSKRDNFLTRAYPKKNKNHESVINKKKNKLSWSKENKKI